MENTDPQQSYAEYVEGYPDAVDKEQPAVDYIGHAVQLTESYPLGEKDGSHLSSLEREWLERVSASGWSLRARPDVDYMNDTRTPAEKAREWTPARLTGESVIIVYRGEWGLSLGAVRGRHVAGEYRLEEDCYEASPFPGAWEWVGVSRILLVRHPTTI